MQESTAAERLLARIALVVFASAVVLPCGLVPFHADLRGGAAMSHSHSGPGTHADAALSHQGTGGTCGTDIAAVPPKSDLAASLPQNAGKAYASLPAARTAFAPSLVAFAGAQARPPRIPRQNTILTQRLQL